MQFSENRCITHCGGLRLVLYIAIQTWHCTWLFFFFCFFLSAAGLDNRGSGYNRGPDNRGSTVVHFLYSEQGNSSVCLISLPVT